MRVHPPPSYNCFYPVVISKVYRMYPYTDTYAKARLGEIFYALRTILIINILLLLYYMSLILISMNKGDSFFQNMSVFYTHANSHKYLCINLYKKITTTLCGLL